MDNELVPSRLGLRWIYFRRAGAFSSEKHFSGAASEMHKYFLDGKIFKRGGFRREKCFGRGSRAGENFPERRARAGETETGGGRREVNALCDPQRGRRQATPLRGAKRAAAISVILWPRLSRRRKRGCGRPQAEARREAGLHLRERRRDCFRPRVGCTRRRPSGYGEVCFRGFAAETKKAPR